MEGDFDEPTRTPRGMASLRIVQALADVFPEVMSRRRFLESDALAARLGKAEGDTLTEAEKMAAAKTLGRLIESGAVGEILFLRPRTTMEGAGAALVAVSVSLNTLRTAWEAWELDVKAWREAHDAWAAHGAQGAEPLRPTEPGQEAIVNEIVQRSKAWVDEFQKASETENISPLVFRDISIVHGSDSFDILVFVLYNNQDQLLVYVREVIQRIAHVERTHTMQISTSFGVLR